GAALVWDLTAALSQRPPSLTVELAAKDLDALWTDLGSDDSGKAWRAAGTLATAPQQALTLLKQRTAIVVADEKVLGQLLAGLDADELKGREGATDELAKLGRKAEAAVRAALKKTGSAEVRLRLTRVLERIEKEPPGKGEPIIGAVLAARAVEL